MPELPTGDWSDEAVLAEPWTIVTDALIYQWTGVALPPELQSAVEHAGIVLTSMALIRAGNIDGDELDGLWERDPLEWQLTWKEADESIAVRAVWGDGEEPASVTTTARGLGGRLNELILSYTPQAEVPMARAEMMGHRTRVDPPTGMTGVERWTCRICGASAVRYGTNVYGSALDNRCPGAS